VKRDRTRVQSGPAERPTADRVAAPHLADSDLVAAPDENGPIRQGIEHAPGHDVVVRDANRTPHRVAQIRDHSVVPAPNLVAKDLEPPKRPRRYRPLGNDPTAVAGAAGTGVISTVKRPIGSVITNAEW
jgi:hypothetical protein